MNFYKNGNESLRYIFFLNTKYKKMVELQIMSATDVTKLNHSQKWWVLCSIAYLRWRRRDVCNFHMIYVDDIILGVSCQKMRYLAEPWLLQIIKGLNCTIIFHFTFWKNSKYDQSYYRFCVQNISYFVTNMDIYRIYNAWHHFSVNYSCFMHFFINKRQTMHVIT